MNGQEIGNFDDIQDVEWVDWKKGEVTVSFQTSEFLKGRNSFDKESYTFAVIEDGAEKLMGVTSKRLMLKLKEFHPLKGKTFSIERIGQNMDTDYNLTEIAV
jgi:hypothetical protein